MTRATSCLSLTNFAVCEQTTLDGMSETEAAERELVAEYERQLARQLEPELVSVHNDASEEVVTAAAKPNSPNWHIEFERV